MKLFFGCIFLLILKVNIFSANLNIPVKKNNIGDTLYLTIGFKENDQATINSLKSQFETISNCKILLFCKNLNVFILMFTGTEGKEISEVFSTTEKKTNSNVKLYLKEGKISEILANCYISESEINSEIKKLQAN